MTGSGKTLPRVSLAILLAGTALGLGACSQMQERFSAPPPKQSPAETPSSSRSDSALPETSRSAQSGSQSGKMAGARGLVNNQRLFDEPVSDPIARIHRIERAVQDLRNDFDTAIPAMAGLIVSESELTQVLKDLKRSGEISYTDVSPPESDTLPSNPLEPKRRTTSRTGLRPDETQKSAGAVAPPRQMTDTFLKAREDNARKKAQEAIESARRAEKDKKQAAKKAAAKKADNAAKAAQKPSPSYSSPQVVGVRVGSYPDKSRIVLDLSAPSTFSVDLDNQEKLLIIEVKDAGWEAKTSYDFTSSKLLDSFTAQDEGANGSRLLIGLEQPVKILKQFALKAAGAKKDRIVIDIGPEN